MRSASLKTASAKGRPLTSANPTGRPVQRVDLGAQPRPRGAVVREQVERPRERRRGGLVPGHEQRHDLVAHLLVAHAAAALLVARGEQPAQEVGPREPGGAASAIILATRSSITGERLLELARARPGHEDWPAEPRRQRLGVRAQRRRRVVAGLVERALGPELQEQRERARLLVHPLEARRDCRADRVGVLERVGVEERAPRDRHRDAGRLAQHVDRRAVAQPVGRARRRHAHRLRVLAEAIVLGECARHQPPLPPPPQLAVAREQALARDGLERGLQHRRSSLRLRDEQIVQRLGRRHDRHVRAGRLHAHASPPSRPSRQQAEHVVAQGRHVPDDRAGAREEGEVSKAAMRRTIAKRRRAVCGATRGGLRWPGDWRSGMLALDAPRGSPSDGLARRDRGGSRVRRGRVLDADWRRTSTCSPRPRRARVARRPPGRAGPRPAVARAARARRPRAVGAAGRAAPPRRGSAARPRPAARGRAARPSTPARAPPTAHPRSSSRTWRGRGASSRTVATSTSPSAAR